MGVLRRQNENRIILLQPTPLDVYLISLVVAGYDELRTQMASRVLDERGSYALSDTEVVVS